MRDEPNPIEQIIARFAEQLPHAPGASRLSRLAKSAKRIPAPVLTDLAALILQLDVQLVGDDIAVSLIEVGFCDLRFADAVDFATALRFRLKRYLREPCMADSARGVLKERILWWGTAIRAAGAACRWPAMVLMDAHSKD